jgi:hypothetical protein
VGVLVLGSTLVEMFAVLRLLHGGDDFVWRILALAIPLALFFVLLRSRSAFSVARVGADQGMQEDAKAEAQDLTPDVLDRKLAEMKACPSVANRIAAADELMNCGRFDEAVPVYQAALAGIYSNEPDFLFKLAQAQIEANVPAAALVTVDRIARDHARYRPEETRLLQARVLEGMGKTRAALDEYESLTSAYVGLEAKCRFGLLLMREGQIQRANEVFQRLMQDAEQSHYAMRVEHHWLRVAAHCQARLQAKVAPLSLEQ